MKKARKQQDSIEQKVLVYNSIAASLNVDQISLREVNNGRMFWMEQNSTEGASHSL